MEQNNLSGLRVMVIDDSKTIRRTAETLLRNVGCEVITAVDGFSPVNSSKASAAWCTAIPAPVQRFLFPVVLRLGRLRGLDKRMFAWLAPAWVAEGASVALVNYRLCPAVRIADIVDDASDLFNYLTGYSNRKDYRQLLVAPLSLRSGLAALVAHAWPTVAPVHLFDDRKPRSRQSFPGIAHCETSALRAAVL